MGQLLLVLIGGFQLSDAASLIFYKGNINNYQVFTLDNADILMNTSYIDKTLETLIYAFGFTGTVNANTTTGMMTACLKDSMNRNCLLLDWEKEASNETVLGVESVPVSYAFKAVPNAITVGERMGKVLIKLSDCGLDLNRVYLMGHSLGAHLWGSAGREVKSKGKDIGTIAGLDPAGPLFNINVLNALNAASASFVYCIHTDPGRLGTSASVCTVDIWANLNHFIIGDNRQPGCTDNRCNHDTAVFLTEYSMLVNKTSLVASKANDYYAWVAANGTATETIYIGDLINKQASSGNYYLTTNGPPNYGKGKEGLRP